MMPASVETDPPERHHMSFSITVEDRADTKTGSSVCDTPPAAAQCDACIMNVQAAAQCDSCIPGPAPGPQASTAPLSPLDD